MNHVLFRDFVIPVPAPARGSAPELIKRMLFVLALRQVFEILCAVVAFLSIFVIHGHAWSAWADKGLSDKTVNKESLHVSVVLQHDSAIPKSITVASHESDAHTSDVPQTRNPVQTFIALNRKPYFYHSFNYTGISLGVRI